MMEDHGMETVKRQRMDSYGARIASQPGPPPPPPGPHQPSPPQQHPDGPAPLPLHGGHPRPLQPPNAYRTQQPHSPYQMHPPSSMGEPAPHGGYPHVAPSMSDADGMRNPRSAPPEQTTFPKMGGMPTQRSPKSAHVQRPMNSSFDSDHTHYPPQPGADLVDPNAGYAPPDGTGHAGHFGNMRMAHPHYDGHAAAAAAPPPPPNMTGQYTEADMVSGGPPAYPPAYNQPQPTAWSSQYATTQPRRHARATQACDTCRTRKVKCDEGKPKCQYCRDNDQPCVYKEVQPPKADRAQKEIIEGQDMIKGEISDLRAEVMELKHLLRDLRQTPRTNATPATEASQPAATALSTAEGGSKNLNALTLKHREIKQERTLEPVNPHRNLEVDHSVGVHRLLRWTSIRKLLNTPQCLYAMGMTGLPDLNEDFVLRLEVEKGTLRAYGRGSGRDRLEGPAEYPAIASNPSTPVPPEDPWVGTSPGSSPPEFWGRELGVPNVVDGNFANQSKTDHPGGLNPDGTLRMDPTTMDLLLRSYVDNLNNLHPFLSRPRLQRLFDRVRAHANPHLSFKPATRKRKLSNSESPMDADMAEPNSCTEEPFLERRIGTAIVLLVMALGKICLVKRPLSGPIPDPRPARKDIPYSMASSPRSADSLAPEPESERQTPLGPSLFARYARHVESTLAANDLGPAEKVRPGDRNVDQIPGLAYYIKAAEILGTLQGGNALMHVQAMLLASLYCGQLASSLEAWSWLSQAGRACVFLMKDFPFTAAKVYDPIRVELIFFAYWTCYQFEGDILAELDLQPSGIEVLHKQREHGIPFPKVIEEATDQNVAEPARIIMYYSFQIHLRTTLNNIQQFLYPPDAYLKARKPDVMLHDRYICRAAIQQWREVLRPVMKWDDNHHLTTDILDARLRAKYYGLMYITNRPLLEYAIHRMNSDITPEIQEAVQKHREAPLQNFQEIRLYVNEMEVYYACVDCIEAAKRSTTAFDGIIFNEQGELENRLIVTNILGTAHAQFGNMLVLSVTYKSRLQFMVDRDELLRLLDRTIRFLRSHRYISHTLAQDADVLEAIWLNIDNPLPSFPSSSFSSSAGGQSSATERPPNAER